MSDFVLRGFCKCGIVTIYGETKDVFEKEIVHYDMQGNKHIPEPVWFLSAKQMKIIWESEEWYAWLDEPVNNGYPRGYNQEDKDMIAEMLELNPFLVAQILKEAENKEENK